MPEVAEPLGTGNNQNTGQKKFNFDLMENSEKSSIVAIVRDSPQNLNDDIRAEVNLEPIFQHQT